MSSTLYKHKLALSEDVHAIVKYDIRKSVAYVNLRFDFKHIYDNLVLFYTTEMLDEYIDGLLVTDRENRWGLPTDVLMLLSDIKEANAKHYK